MTDYKALWQRLYDGDFYNIADVMAALEEAHALQEENERLKASRDYDQDMTSAMALDMSSIVEGKVERLHATEELLAEAKERIAALEKELEELRDTSRSD